MARTKITANTAGINSSSVLTRTTVAAGATGTSGYYIDGFTKDQNCAMTVQVDGATGVLTIKEGDLHNDSQGDLSITLAGASTTLVGPLEGARFRTSDGYVNIDMGGATGIVEAFQIG